MQRKIYLEGELGAKFGKEYTMNVNSFSEVFRCLECNFSNFREYLISCAENNVGFVCEVAGQPLNSETELLLEYGEGDMVITSIPAGSKSGALKILAAIAIATLVIMNPAMFVTATNAQTLGAMAASGVANPGTIALLKAGATLNLAGLAAAGISVHLAMTGMQQMMAPDPSVDNDQEESYLFQGTGQALVEGDPVPVLYGKLRVPGRPISLQLRNERLNFTDHGKVYADSTADTTNGVTVTTSGSSGGGSVLSQEEQQTQLHR
jgi:predicted phage tail protein